MEWTVLAALWYAVVTVRVLWGGAAVARRRRGLGLARPSRAAQRGAAKVRGLSPLLAPYSDRMA